MSLSVQIAPADKRCQYWAKIIRSNIPLRLPEVYSGGNDLPGPYLKIGDEELLEGDFLIEGEANHPRLQRGWNYRISYFGGGKFFQYKTVDGTLKVSLKNQGMESELLKGAGGVAAAIRVLHGLRKGMEV